MASHAAFAAALALLTLWWVKQDAPDNFTRVTAPNRINVRKVKHMAGSKSISPDLFSQMQSNPSFLCWYTGLMDQDTLGFNAYIIFANRLAVASFREIGKTILKSITCGRFFPIHFRFARHKFYLYNYQIW